MSQLPPLLYKLITRHNPYTPQLFGQFVLNASAENREVAPIKQLYRFRTLLVFLDLPGSAMKLVKHIDLLWAITRRFHPAQYIFAHVVDPYKAHASYEGYNSAPSYSKLVLFNIHESPESAYVPCLPCQSILKLSNRGLHLLREIDVTWNSLNYNFHRKIVKVYASNVVQQDGDCRPIRRNFVKIYKPDFVHYPPSEKNLTSLIYTGE